MKEPYGKGLATRPGPESYVGYGNKPRKALTGHTRKLAASPFQPPAPPAQILTVSIAGSCDWLVRICDNLRHLRITALLLQLAHVLRVVIVRAGVWHPAAGP